MLCRFSIPQTQQPYSHMDMDLKKSLLQKLEDVAPEYGLVELSYPSFMRCYGYRSQPLSAADAVESIGALLEIAGGVKMEIEAEGARNGGEWFSGGRIWEATAGRQGKRNRGAIDVDGRVSSGEVDDRIPLETTSEEATAEKRPAQWWVNNFWTAFDALDECAHFLLAR